MPNRWTDFVKEYAKANDLTYGCALGKPECKEGYRKKYGVAKKVSQKKEQESMGGEDMDAPAPKKENISFKVSEKKGRKPKYATDEERKAAKRAQTLASNAKKKQEKIFTIPSTNKEKEQMKKAEAYLIQTIEEDVDAFFDFDDQTYRTEPRLYGEDYDDFERRFGIEDIAKKFGVSPRELFNLYDDWSDATYPGYRVKKDGRTANGNGKSQFSYKEAKKRGVAVKGKGITEVCDCGDSDCDCMEGTGVFGDIVNTAKKATQAVAKVQGKIQTGVAKGVKKVVEKVGGDYANALLYGRNDYSPKVRAILEKFGGEVVRSASIVRNPVQQVLVEAMNVVSFGAFKKNMKDADYDQLFHLQLDFTLESGKEMRVEKVEVINMDESLTNKADGQIRPISKMPTGMTLNAMMENTKNAMGGKFFLYSAKDNNCQDFLLAVLTANGMGDAEDYAFVKQNTAQLFKGLDTLRKVSNTLTDIGSKVNIATTGAGISSSSADVIHHHHHYHHSGDDFNKVMDSISSGKSGKAVMSSGSGIAKKGRFVKGSPEAAAFMKALRDKRQSKK